MYYKNKDEWFDKYWADKITPPFASWWKEFYGFPEEYTYQKDGVGEYFTRMAFAFVGWTEQQKKIEEAHRLAMLPADGSEPKEGDPDNPMDILMRIAELTK